MWAKRAYGLAAGLSGALVCVFALSPTADADELVLVEDGVSRAPVVVFEDSPPLVCR